MEVVGRIAHFKASNVTYPIFIWWDKGVVYVDVVLGLYLRGGKVCKLVCTAGVGVGGVM